MINMNNFKVNISAVLIKSFKWGEAYLDYEDSPWPWHVADEEADVIGEMELEKPTEE